ncbi:type III secretion protein [Paucibacter sp. KBW04]|uniref:flagellar biosynthetic protein FliR n=1 Tax=Paucibacter sp. KBW04 TaxID=2153361 RepID=UPI000F5753A4|nr:flagellar biosynthetic protein FliR [Paucibacter sp. KBW04]RQO63583.1 type III secretion protein [Paucibacter sp. KBW04]
MLKVLDEGWMLTTLLVWVRIGVLLFLSPFVSAAKLPATVIVLLGFALAGFLVGALQVRAPMSVAAPGSFVFAVIAEALTGALMGFALQCAFASFSMAGQILDLQMGFGVGTLFDPVTRANTPVLGSVLAMFAVMYFFGVEGHQAFLRGVVFSLEAVPPGTQGWQSGVVDLLRPVAAMFTTALAVIAPTLFILLLLEVVLMITSRVLPQMNVFFVAVSAKILVGLIVLAITAAFVGPVMSRAYAGLFRFWDGVLR